MCTNTLPLSLMELLTIRQKVEQLSRYAAKAQRRNLATHCEAVIQEIDAWKQDVMP